MNRDQAQRLLQIALADTGAQDRCPGPNGPVLLVDDVVDSGWTLTTIAALLRQAGSGCVYPAALATASVKE